MQRILCVSRGKPLNRCTKKEIEERETKVLSKICKNFAHKKLNKIVRYCKKIRTSTRVAQPPTYFPENTQKGRKHSQTKIFGLWFSITWCSVTWQWERTCCCLGRLIITVPLHSAVFVWSQINACLATQLFLSPLPFTQEIEICRINCGSFDNQINRFAFFRAWKNFCLINVCQKRYVSQLEKISLQMYDGNEAWVLPTKTKMVFFWNGHLDIKICWCCHCWNPRWISTLRKNKQTKQNYHKLTDVEVTRAFLAKACVF